MFIKLSKTRVTDQLEEEELSDEEKEHYQTWQHRISKAWSSLRTVEIFNQIAAERLK